MAIETRPLRCMINKAGGNAGKESLNYKLSIPSAWAAAMGITKDSRELAVTFDGSKIVIEKGSETAMKDTEILKAALEKALSECNEVHIKDVAAECGIKHIKTNDLLVMCKNLLRKYPEYRLVKFLEPGQRPESVCIFQAGVLTCCEYDDGREYEEQ